MIFSPMVMNHQTSNITGTTCKLDIFGDGSCIAVYNFDGNVNDLSGNYNGTWIGTEQYDTGVYNQSAKFVTSDDGVLIDTLPTIEDFTISSWVKWDGSNAKMPIYLKGDNNDIFLYWVDGNIYKYYETDSYVDNNKGTTDWQFIVIKYSSDDSLFTMSLDANYSETMSSNKVIGSNPILKLGYSYKDTYRFGGLIDQVRIFNRALTDTEIEELYNETACT